MFGTGNYLGLEVNTSKYNRTIVFSTVDPYFTIDGISRALDVYYRTSRPLNSQGEDYKLVTAGLASRFGVPFSEFDTVFFGIGSERTEIQGDTALPNNFFLYTRAVRRHQQQRAAHHRLVARQPRQRAGADRRPLPAGQPGLGRARRRALRARQRAGPAVLPARQALHLSPSTAKIGWGKGSRGHAFPIFKNFYCGGLGSVRGFDQGSLGPVDVTGAYIGGNRRITINDELYLPLPGAGNDRTLRMFGYRRRRQRVGREREAARSASCAHRPASA